MAKQNERRSGKVAITGATGFIGRHLVAHLSQQGCELTLLVQDVRNCPSVWRNQDNIHVVETGPLETASNLNEALSGVLTVIHLAGLAHSKNASPELMHRANTRATELIAEAAFDQRIRTFVYLSSIAAVTANALASVVDDGVTPQPVDAYGESKRRAEIQVSKLADSGILAVSIRPPLVVGAEAPANWRLLQRLASTGLPLPFGSIRNRRSYIGVTTLVGMLAHLCHGNWSVDRSGDYCVASPASLSLAEVIGLLRRGMKKRAMLFPVPVEVLKGGLRLAGRERMIRSLLGDLQIDGARFDKVFGFRETEHIREAIVASGRDFAAAGRKEM